MLSPFKWSIGQNSRVLGPISRAEKGYFTGNFSLRQGGLDLVNVVMMINQIRAFHAIQAAFWCFYEVGRLRTGSCTPYNGFGGAPHDAPFSEKTQIRHFSGQNISFRLYHFDKCKAMFVKHAMLCAQPQNLG